ncbi:MAG: tRNA (N6-threonylcarbamoyladenosine(37)-N6)-methyltransferase TrmO [Pirellulaceae bacterium]|nr:tRNA (N6-threonylcarbamoyladenosine(37)-N6)-methyltransferase TrmO [Planctomycetales bacterium]
MAQSRRAFVAKAAMLTTAGGTFIASSGSIRADDVSTAPTSEATYEVYPIGVIEKKDGSSRVRIFDKYADGLLGLDQWSHVNVFYWFDKNDTPQRRSILQVHPRGDAQNPLTGVFACRAPVRPNLIALTVCRIIAVEKNVVTVDQLDAFDATPVIDLKPFIPPDEPRKDIKVPKWTGNRPPAQ